MSFVIKESFGKRLRQSRKSKGMTTDALSQRCGVNASYIRQIECGKKAPALQMLVKLCNGVPVSPDFLLSDSLEPTGEHEALEQVVQKLRTLTPKQLQIVSSMVDAVVDLLEG